MVSTRSAARIVNSGNARPDPQPVAPTNHGGARPGAGRPRGSVSKTGRARRAVRLRAVAAIVGRPATIEARGVWELEQQTHRMLAQAMAGHQRRFDQLLLIMEQCVKETIAALHADVSLQRQQQLDAMHKALAAIEQVKRECAADR